MGTPPSKPRSNVQRLLAEGFVIDNPDSLPKAYEDVIEGLTPDEVALLIDVTRRLERAQASAPEQPYKNFIPPL
jgi:hypothetical protein